MPVLFFYMISCLFKEYLQIIYISLLLFRQDFKKGLNMMARALALISGGLDSILAAKLIKDQNIEVIGICFKSAFFSYENAVKMAEQIDIPLKIVDFTEEHLEMVKNPKHGYGKNMNPCIDCHAMMMRYAGRLLNELQADFIITGEILNQRPMSQNMKSLDIVKKESGFEEFILRPLCAKNLPPTKMEEMGLVSREKLLDISGRSRKTQMELADKWGIREYPSPAGGCKLTEPNFSKRLKDLFKYKKNCKSDDIEILKYGRHFRINDRVKIISTRDETEAGVIKTLIKDYCYIFSAADYSGSLIILEGNPEYDDIVIAARIAGRYSKGKDEKEIDIRYKKAGDEKYNIIRVVPAGDEEINAYII